MRDQRDQKDQPTEPETKKPADPELSAMKRINNILAALDPTTAQRVARYCVEKATQRYVDNLGAMSPRTAQGGN